MPQFFQAVVSKFILLPEQAKPLADDLTGGVIEAAGDLLVDELFQPGG